MSGEQRTDDPGKHFNNLSPPAAEALALLTEECAEVVQAVGKILRHGVWSEHPESGIPNYSTLQREVGDLLAALRICEVEGLVDWGRAIRARDEKLMRISKYLHHAKAQKDD